MLREQLQKAARGAGFGAATLAAGVVITSHLAAAQGVLGKAEARDRWSGLWARTLLKIFDVRLVVRGDPGHPGIGRGRGRVVVANHRSIIDIAVLLSRFGGAVLSRGEIERWPIIGFAARSGGTIFVDRSDKKSGAKAIDAMVERLGLDDTICIFPEGTTFVDDPVRPFRVGAFVAAARAGASVLPVGLAYPLDSRAAYGGETFLEHLGNLASSRSTRVYAEIGAEMLPNPGEPPDAFAERCRAEVERLVSLARKRERAEVAL